MRTRKIHNELHGIPKPEGTLVEKKSVLFILDDGTQKKHKVNIGGVSKDGEDTMIPNDNLRIHFPKLWNQYIPSRYALEHSLKLGLYACALGTGYKTGLYSLLSEALLHEGANALMDLAIYANLSGEEGYTSSMERELFFSKNPREEELHRVLEKAVDEESTPHVEEGWLKRHEGCEALLILFPLEGLLCVFSRKGGCPLCVAAFSGENLREVTEGVKERLSGHGISLVAAFWEGKDFSEKEGAIFSSLGLTCYRRSGDETLMQKVLPVAKALSGTYEGMVLEEGIFAQSVVLNEDAQVYGTLVLDRRLQEKEALRITREALLAIRGYEVMPVKEDYCFPEEVAPYILLKDGTAVLNGEAIRRKKEEVGLELLMGSGKMEAGLSAALSERAKRIKEILGRVQKIVKEPLTLPLAVLTAGVLSEELVNGAAAFGATHKEAVLALEEVYLTLRRGCVYAGDVKLSPLACALLGNAGIREEDIVILAEDVNRRFSLEEGGETRLMPQGVLQSKIKHRGRKPKEDKKIPREKRQRGRPMGRKNKATLEWEAQIAEEAQELGITFEEHLKEKKRERDSLKRLERRKNAQAMLPEGEVPERRGPGRPPGRKNNKTLEREAAQRAAAEQALKESAEDK